MKLNVLRSFSIYFILILIWGCASGGKSGKTSKSGQLKLSIVNAKFHLTEGESFLNIYVLDDQFNSIHFERLLVKTNQHDVIIPASNSNKIYIRVLQFNAAGDKIHNSAYYEGIAKEQITLQMKSGKGPVSASIFNLPVGVDQVRIKQQNKITDVVNIDQSNNNIARFVISHIQDGQNQLSIGLYKNGSPLLEGSKTIHTDPGKSLRTEILLGESNDNQVLVRIGFPIQLINKRLNELSYLNWVQMPNIYTSKIEPSAIDAPNVIKDRFVVVSPTYEVNAIDRNQNLLDHVKFDRGIARLVFTIDPETIDAFDLSTDFAGFSWNENSNEWETAASTIYNEKNSEVWVYTRHLSTFVLTAVPASNTNVHDYPHCISEDFPDGIGGSGNAQFTIIEPFFKYYQDRNYFIVPLGQSAENTRTFNELGFHRAMGIATCNGGSACGTVGQHKSYNGDDYIKFEAHKDIDVYILYDSRGGSSYDDKSNDASWISNMGFEATDYYLETTDAVGLYGIYKKTYLKNDTVRLHGNLKGVSGITIGTNYWLIIKEAGNLDPSDASELCENSPPTDPPPYIENAIAVGGNNKVTLSWDNPTYSNFEGVVIRKSTTTPPLSLAEGIEPQGLVIDPETFIDNDVVNEITYYYSIFALDKNYNYGNVFILEASPGLDSDNDGLSDNYEDTAKYSNNAISDKNNADTDNDGWDDLKEVLAGFDPTVPFIEPDQDSVYAGIDSSTCTDQIQLEANYYSVGKGRWEVVQGNASIALPHGFSCNAMNLSLGDNVFRWIVGNGPYEKFDDVVIRRESDTITPIFSIGDTSICGDSISLSANFTSFPSYWTFSDTSAIMDSLTNNIRLSNIQSGTNYIKWHITHPACPQITDSVRITTYDPEIVANAGEDLFINQNSIQLNANLPANASGNWKRISGSGNLANPNDPKTLLNGILSGIHKYEWTLDNGLCGISKDTLKIIFDNVPPSINSFKLSANHIMGSIAVNLDIDAFDNVGIKTWVIKEVHRQSNTTNTYTTKQKPILYNLQHAEDGNYRLYLSAIDAAGNRYDFPNDLALTVNNRVPTRLKMLPNNGLTIADLNISGNYIAWIEKPYHYPKSGKLYLYNIHDDEKKLIQNNARSILYLNGNQLTFQLAIIVDSLSAEYEYEIQQYRDDTTITFKLGNIPPYSWNLFNEHATWVVKKDSATEEAFYFNGSKIIRVDSLINPKYKSHSQDIRPITPHVFFPWNNEFRKAYSKIPLQSSEASLLRGWGHVWATMNESKGIVNGSWEYSFGTIYGMKTTVECYISEFYDNKVKTLNYNNFVLRNLNYSNSAYVWSMNPKIKLNGRYVDSSRVEVLYKRIGSDKVHTIYKHKKLYRPYTIMRENAVGDRKLDLDISGNMVVYSKEKDISPVSNRVMRDVFFFDGNQSHLISISGDNSFPKISGNNVIWINREYEDDGYGGLKIKSENVMLATP